MSFAGEYVVDKVMSMGEGGFVLLPIDEAKAKLDDPHDIQEMEKMKNMVLTVEEDGSAYMGMPIPEGTPQAEIDKAVSRGMEVKDGCLIIEKMQTKAEGNDLFMYDRQQMLTGEEWVKITTENEGELNLIMYTYKRK